MKYSVRRSAVRKALCETRSHPTAAELYKSVKAEVPSISLGTVYRNLALLADRGEIVRVYAGTVERYDADTSQHSHFCCTRCGMVADAEVEGSEELAAQCERTTGARVERTSVVFFGVCPGCEGGE